MVLARKHDVLRGLRDSGDRREEVAQAPGPRVQSIRPSEAIQLLENTIIIVTGPQGLHRTCHFYRSGTVVASSCRNLEAIPPPYNLLTFQPDCEKN